MSSGEGDAIRSIAVNTSSSTIPNNTWTYFPAYPDTNTSTTTGYNFNYGWPSIVYKYQIKCPIKTCKKMNWLELDKITPCTNCSAKLKAVSEQADFEVPVEK